MDQHINTAATEVSQRLGFWIDLPPHCSIIFLPHTNQRFYKIFSIYPAECSSKQNFFLNWQHRRQSSLLGGQSTDQPFQKRTSSNTCAMRLQHALLLTTLFTKAIFPHLKTYSCTMWKNKGSIRTTSFGGCLSHCILYQLKTISHPFLFMGINPGLDRVNEDISTSGRV